ncbi:GNAT family N-acetyltransferase [uncultured Odoribacter sp.]|uniref:GNAT family N-acetyltransferase n=1 Tax=uncultured Odoribacter sp. TaxID=876416 RepID=UPI00261BAE5E|nr:GNAT family N-acetyltransferase [uncultured Odoribacter sp.]
MRYRIRNAEYREIPVLARLFQETLVQVNSRDYTGPQIEAWGRRADEERWKELFNSSLQFMVAENEEYEIVGFTSVNSRGYIHSMFVDYRFQRKGIACLLLAKAGEYARENGASVLSADVSITARPFFEKQGFCIKQKNRVNLGGITMINYTMEKQL